MCDRCLPFTAIAVHEPADGYGRLGVGTPAEWFHKEVSQAYLLMVEHMKAQGVPVRAVVVTIRACESTEEAQAIAGMEANAEGIRREMLHGQY